MCASACLPSPPTDMIAGLHFGCTAHTPLAPLRTKLLWDALREDSDAYEQCVNTATLRTVTNATMVGVACPNQASMTPHLIQYLPPPSGSKEGRGARWCHVHGRDVRARTPPDGGTDAYNAQCSSYRHAWTGTPRTASPRGTACRQASCKTTRSCAASHS